MVFPRRASKFTKLSREIWQNFPRKPVGPSDDADSFIFVFLALLDFILLTATHVFGISL